MTTTTHKTLRGPRGGMILTKTRRSAKKIDSAVFPGLQGGPLMHVIAAKAVAFGEKLRPEFKLYAQSVVANAKALAPVVIERGYAIVSGGTDNHLMLVDLRPKGVKGNAAEQALERAGITCNKNGVPFDPEKPTRHLGHPARHAGRHHPRLRRQGIPGRRPLDQRRARRAWPPGTAVPPNRRSRRGWPSSARASRSTADRERLGSGAVRLLAHRVQQA